ncbi:MAG: hypothetical protein AAB316_13620, partial [Bacteroidota bacterium]
MMNESCPKRWQGAKPCRRFTWLLMLFGFVCLAGCTHEIKSYQAYLAFLANEKNGLLKKKSVAGLDMQVKYFPDEFLALGEIQKEGLALTESRLDSITQLYQNQLTFLMTLGPEQGTSFDVTTVGVSDYQEFAR